MKATSTLEASANDAEIRADHLRTTLGSMAIEGHHLDKKSLAICDRYVRGEIDLETLGRLFDDVIYANCPGARLDA